MIIFQKWIFRVDLQANPDLLYVFGDNEIRQGLGGQAKEMRGEPNAYGVATLAAPGVLWTEDNVQHQCNVVLSDLRPLFTESRPIVWPLDGIGTGFADLANASPTTWAFLQARIAELHDSR